MLRLIGNAVASKQVSKKLELLVYVRIDILQRRLYAEKHNRKHFLK
jgi:hypothetical protein